MSACRVPVSLTALVALAVSASAQTPVPPAGGPTLAQIREVWKAREEKVRSARVEMSFEQTMHKGYASFMEKVSRRGQKPAADPEPNPPRDIVEKGTAVVALKGGKLRYTYDRPDWDPIEKTLFQSRFADTFDGKRYKHLRDPMAANEKYALAGIRVVPKSESSTQFPIAALFLTVRGVHPQFNQDIDKYTPTGRMVPVSGRPCVELAMNTTGEDERDLLYLDAERGYVVVRMVTLIDGRPRWQLDVSYQPDPTVGWLPRAWEYLIAFGVSGQLHASGRYTVTKFEVNPVIDDAEFDLVFPPGTRVVDQTTGEEVQYVVRDDGENGRAIASSVNPSYEELQKGAPRFNLFVLLALWGGAIAVVTGVWWAWQRRKNRSGGAPAGP